MRLHCSLNQADLFGARLLFIARHCVCVLTVLAGLFTACRVAPTLPDDLGYSAIAAGATADISSAGDIRSRLEVIVSLMDRKSAEMSSLSSTSNGALEPVERSYVKLARAGLIPTLDQAVEDGEDAGEVALGLIPRLENQRRSIERIRSSLTLGESEGSLTAVKLAIARAREIAGLGSNLPAGAQTPRTGTFSQSERLIAVGNRHQVAGGGHQRNG